MGETEHRVIKNEENGDDEKISGRFGEGKKGRDSESRERSPETKTIVEQNTLGIIDQFISLRPPLRSPREVCRFYPRSADNPRVSLNNRRLPSPKSFAECRASRSRSRPRSSPLWCRGLRESLCTPEI